MNNQYGINDGIVNLVKNEMAKTKLINEREIFNKVNEFFPDEHVRIVDISDVIYHLKD